MSYGYNDINTHVDNSTNHFTSQFLSLLSSFNLTQHVYFPTHKDNHTLDLVIISSDCSLSPPVSMTHISPSSLILSIYLLAPEIFTLLSKNPLSLPSSKKPTLDKEELSNYRPISNLSVISNIIERVVKSRLTEHLSTNNITSLHTASTTVLKTLLKRFFCISMTTSSMP